MAQQTHQTCIDPIRHHRETTEAAVFHTPHEVNVDRSKVTCEVQSESIIQCPDEDAECTSDSEGIKSHFQMVMLCYQIALQQVP